MALFWLGLFFLFVCFQGRGEVGGRDVMFCFLTHISKQVGWLSFLNLGTGIKWHLPFSDYSFEQTNLFKPQFSHL